jgi:hypothetical protein
MISINLLWIWAYGRDTDGNKELIILRSMGIQRKVEVFSDRL